MLSASRTKPPKPGQRARLAWLARPAAVVTRWLPRVRHFGWARYCPVCRGRLARFQPFGVTPRPEAQCPLCGSLERERAQVLLIPRRLLPRLPARHPLRILHVAPEGGVARLLRRLPSARYVSLNRAPGAMLQGDLTQLGLATASVDLVFLSHVLEHIEDDAAAIGELYRALAPGGIAFVEVPLRAGPTLEDPAVTQPDERERLYGQADHVRYCGSDYVDRLTRAGFAVEILAVREAFTPAEIVRMRLCPETSDPIAWLCRKPEETR